VQQLGIRIFLLLLIVVASTGVKQLADPSIQVSKFQTLCVYCTGPSVLQFFAGDVCVGLQVMC
jgi:hypothetical protein